jgi:septum formation protein
MALWLAAEALVLASGSAVRRMLLEAAGIPVEIVAPEIDERAAEAELGGADAPAIAMHLARAKARAVSRRKSGRLVVGADQILTLGAQRFSKPADRATARAQLLTLRGHTHVLHCAVAAVRDGDILFEHADGARLTMRPFSEGFLDDYLNAAGAAATASVGGYQLEGHGVQLFERIEGDYFTILGLPLLPLLAFLRTNGCLAE